MPVRLEAGLQGLRPQRGACTRLSVAVPARAVCTRLLTASELPSWAAYLPPELASAGFSPLGSPKASAGADCLGCPRLSPEVTLEEGASAKLPAAVKRVLGRVWDLAREPEGCREVQLALEAAQSDQARAAIAAELEGHVWDAVRCPHANHVIQKCVVAMRPSDLQFILEELMAGCGPPSGASQAARHRYGCRVVERLMEHCPPDQVRPLMRSLIAEGVALSRHPYGNYVMQHLLEHGPADQRRCLIRLLAQYPQATGSDCYARAVISKALSFGSREDQVVLTYALIREPGLLASMARTRHGHTAAKFALQRLDRQGRAEAAAQLRCELPAVRASRYGRSIAAFLEQNSVCSP